jgi:hypothetical protein
MDSQGSLIRAAAGIAALAFLPAACGSPGKGTGEFRATGIPVAENSPVALRAAAAEPASAASVLAQYRRFHVVLEDALATNDPAHLTEVATGLAARQLTETVRQQARQGIVRRGHDAVNPRIALLRHGMAVVVDCVVTGGLWTYRVRNGARTDAAPPPTATPMHKKFRALLTLTDGVWKVAETSVPADSRC